ncbi:MAG: methylated-DNA--[protein]-cysteine S-methyltransferase [Nitrospinota bacterium]|nr:methylated-DNA--[protein]-cysteine S-methyltransferase [Nitrospinota bacterium]MEE3253355.1 methylated-DNA--[protein]-cysteine S-methyltransferase [Nitrospinota bacterium]
MIKVYSRTPLNKPVIYTIFSNPIGLTGLVATSNGLILIINNLKNESSIKQYLSLLTNAEITKQPSEFKDLVKQFSLYFKGTLRIFDFPLDLSLGTPFQQKVWKKLLTIPYGKTRSYKWLASKIKNPQASRAVGNANGMNPLPIVIPCHRIIKENGDLGGYTGGIVIKRFLINLEQIN